MDYKCLFSRVRQYVKLISPITVEIDVCDAITHTAKHLWRDDADLGIQGLYVLATPDGEAIYVGQSELGTIKERAWKHLGPPKNRFQRTGGDKEQGFPEPALNCGAYPDIAAMFAQGTIVISAVQVKPKDCISMLESFAIWTLKKEPRCLNIRS